MYYKIAYMTLIDNIPLPRIDKIMQTLHITFFVSGGTEPKLGKSILSKMRNLSAPQQLVNPKRGIVIPPSTILSL